MDKGKKLRVVVVGINHAGTTALKSILKHNPGCEVIAYDRNDNISFLGCGIALWVGNEFSNPKGLFYANPAQLEERGVQIHMSTELVKLDSANKKLTLHDVKNNKTFEDHYDKLILATGSWPILAPGNRKIPGLLDDSKPRDFLNNNEYPLTEGIYLSKLYQHAQEIIKKSEQPNVKKIVVIGGGYIGIELVEAFAKSKKDVTLIDLADRIMGNYYDEDFTRDVEESMRKDGVKLALRETLDKFIVENGKVKQVVTNKNTYDCDMVIWSTGFISNIPYLKDKNGVNIIETDARGSIVVDKYFRTSDHSIFAIGDCILIESNAMNKKVNISLATNAVRSGIVAGINVAKNSDKEMVPFPGVQGTSAIAVFGWKLCATGLSETLAKIVFGADNVESAYLCDWAYPPFMQENHKIKIKVVWDKKSRRIIGAAIGSLENHSEAIHMFSLAILKQLTIDELPLVDTYFLPHFNKPYNYITSVALLASKILDEKDIVYPGSYEEKDK